MTIDLSQRVAALRHHFNNFTIVGGGQVGATGSAAPTTGETEPPPTIHYFEEIAGDGPGFIMIVEDIPDAITVTNIELWLASGGSISVDAGVYWNVSGGDDVVFDGLELVDVITTPTNYPQNQGLPPGANIYIHRPDNDPENTMLHVRIAYTIP